MILTTDGFVGVVNAIPFGSVLIRSFDTKGEHVCLYVAPGGSVVAFKPLREEMYG